MKMVVGRPFLQSGHLFDGLRIEYVTAYTVSGISRITDNGTLLYPLYHPADQSDLRIIRINF
jgi:hypothetical protein